MILVIANSAGLSDLTIKNVCGPVNGFISLAGMSAIIYEIFHVFVIPVQLSQSYNWISPVVYSENIHITGLDICPLMSKVSNAIGKDCYYELVYIPTTQSR